ncbi:hypothetical protein [Actinacidiphila glaucinigra]|uniref:hypothetical protein n=1 Tax=Actinacidiphila glaucinigra TaxID=235986 RepID=UPI00380FF79B
MIHYIVMKLEQKSDVGELSVTEEVEVAPKVEDAVDRIGAFTGDIFAVWSVPGRPNPGEAEAYVQTVPPEEMWVISGEWPFQLADRYLERVTRAGRG